MLNQAEVNFPKENFPLDRYSIFFMQLYVDVQDTAKANQYFDEMLNFYEQELAYFSQFKGNKAKGVYGSIQDAAQVVYILYNNAERTLKDSERATNAKRVLDTYIGNIGI